MSVFACLLQLCMSALAAGWNALAYDLRQRDLLSNKELACVTFEHLLLDEAQEQEVRDLGLLTVLPARCATAAHSAMSLHHNCNGPPSSEQQMYQTSYLSVVGQQQLCSWSCTIPRLQGCSSCLISKRYITATAFQEVSKM